MRTSPLLLILRLFLLILPSFAQATTLFSNLGQSSSGTAAGIAVVGDLVATEFTTGASASSITGATLRLQNNDIITHTYSAHIYSSTLGVPGTLVASFTAVDGTLAAGSVELATYSHTGIPLAANTTYWLAIAIGQNSALSSSGFVETLSDVADVGSSFSNATPPNMAQSPNSGGFWASTSSAQNGQFSLEGTLSPVPEPSRALLAALGLAALFIKRRRA